jgi:DNA-binding transcriptional LysR family regulator
VEQQLRVMNHAEVQKNLLENRADLVVMALVPEDRALAFIPFRDNELLAVAAAQHPLAQARGELTLLQLAEATLLMREPGSGSRRAFELHCAEQGVRLRRLQQLGSLEAVRCGVEAGMGVAVLPRDACARELAAGVLRQLPVRGLPLRRSWCAVYPRRKHLTPVAQAFLEFITRGDG